MVNTSLSVVRAVLTNMKKNTMTSHRIKTRNIIVKVIMIKTKAITKNSKTDLL